MTREEAIQIFLDRGWIKTENGTYFDGNKWREAIMVISDYFRNEYKALLQEPIFDKIIAEIIAEIDREEKWLMQAGYNTYNVDIAFSAIKSVLKESEVEE